MAWDERDTVKTLGPSDIICASRFWELADVVLVDPAAYGIGALIDSRRYDNICNVHRTPEGAQIDRESLKKIRDARTIYVCSNLLDIFANNLDMLVQREIVLITGVTDENITSKWAGLADDQRIAHWFAQNVDIAHAKVTPIPIGIANEIWPHGSKQILLDAMDLALERELKIYLNYKLTNFGPRLEIAKHFLGREFVKEAGGKPFAEYLRDLRGCEFCFSPPGNGIDCHRTWECLYLGTLPVVSDGPWLAGFEDLPMIVVDDWSRLTWEQIVDRGAALRPMRLPESPKLRFPWWAERIRERVR